MFRFHRRILSCLRQQAAFRFGFAKGYAYLFPISTLFDYSSGALDATRDERWTEALAVGSQAFVEKVKSELGPKALHRGLEPMDGTYALRESGNAYSGHFAVENEALRPENTLFWDTIAEVP